MTDIISKIIGIILTFILLVITPMTISRMSDDMAVKRQVLNEAQIFIDRVTDKASIDENDIDDLLIGINSHGGAFSAEVTRYVHLSVKDTVNNAVKTVYVAADDDINSLGGASVINLERGDAVQVKVEGILITKGQSLIQAFLGVMQEPFAFSLAGTVR